MFLMNQYSFGCSLVGQKDGCFGWDFSRKSSFNFKGACQLISHGKIGLNSSTSPISSISPKMYTTFLHSFNKYSNLRNNFQLVLVFPSALYRQEVSMLPNRTRREVTPGRAHTVPTGVASVLLKGTYYTNRCEWD